MFKAPFAGDCSKPDQLTVLTFPVSGRRILLHNFLDNIWSNDSCVYLSLLWSKFVKFRGENVTGVNNTLI